MIPCHRGVTLRGLGPGARAVPARIVPVVTPRQRGAVCSTSHRGGWVGVPCREGRANPRRRRVAPAGIITRFRGGSSTVRNALYSGTAWSLRSHGPLPTSIIGNHPTSLMQIARQQWRSRFRSCGCSSVPTKPRAWQPQNT